MKTTFERLKSALLILLVILSILLSFSLWNNTPVYESLDPGGYVSNPAFGLGRSVDQVLKPTRIEVQLEKNSFSVIGPFTDSYNKAWDELRKLAVHDLTLIEDSNKEKQFIQATPHIKYQFGMELNQDQVFQILKIVESNRVELRVSNLTVYRDSAGGGIVVLSDKEGPKYRARIGGQTQLFEWLAQAPNLPKYAEFKGANGSLLIPKEKLKIPLETYERIYLPSDALSRTFFVDPTITRKIQERNGSLLVTDGNRTVQISANGNKIRYSSSQPFDQQSASDGKDNSFLRAVDFSNEHGGLQGTYIGLLQNSWGEDHRKYVFTEFRNGLPLIQGLTDVQLTLSGNEVVEMQRSSYYLGRQVQTEWVEVNPPPVLLSESVDAIYLAYGYEVEGDRIRLFPVWVIQSQRTPIQMYNAQTGERWQEAGE